MPVRNILSSAILRTYRFWVIRNANRAIQYSEMHCVDVAAESAISQMRKNRSSTAGISTELLKAKMARGTVTI